MDSMLHQLNQKMVGKMERWKVRLFNKYRGMITT